MKLKEVRVQPGDTLWKLAEEHYGDGQRWRDIFLLNATRLTYLHQNAPHYIGPDYIYPGDKLDIIDGVEFAPSGN